MPEEMRESPGGRSMLSLDQACNRKWAWKYLKGFKLKDIAPHFILGQALHTAHETFYKNNFDYYLALGSMKKYLTDHDPSLINKAEAGFAKWYNEIGVIDKSNIEVLAVEEEVFLTLNNGFVMTCRLDRLLKSKSTGEIFICDTKTTSNRSSIIPTLRNYNYHDQPKLYYMAALETLPELMKDCRGWKTDGIRMAQKVLKGEPQDYYYTEAVRSEIITFRSRDLEDVKLSYSAHVDNLAYRLALVEKYNEPIALNFPRMGDNCLAYFSICPYYNICHQIDNIPEVPGNFELDNWLTNGTVLNKLRELPIYKET